MAHFHSARQISTRPPSEVGRPPRSGLGGEIYALVSRILPRKKESGLERSLDGGRTWIDRSARVADIPAANSSRAVAFVGPHRVDRSGGPHHVGSTSRGRDTPLWSARSSWRGPTIAAITGAHPSAWTMSSFGDSHSWPGGRRWRGSECASLPSAAAGRHRHPPRGMTMAFSCDGGVPRPSLRISDGSTQPPLQRLRTAVADHPGRLWESPESSTSSRGRMASSDRRDRRTNATRPSRPKRCISSTRRRTRP